MMGQIRMWPDSWNWQNLAAPGKMEASFWMPSMAAGGSSSTDRTPESREGLMRMEQVSLAL